MSGASLRELELRPGYDSGDDALRRFYVPALQRAVRYDRSVGYFRSSSLSVAAQGLAHFISGGGRMRLLVGTDLTEEDCRAMSGRIQVPDVLAERLASELVPADEIADRRLEVLAWLLQARRLFVRIAVPVDEEGGPVPGGADAPYFHEKIGVLRDATGDGIAFQGSVNESRRAWSRNFESFSVFASWESDPRHFDHWAARFEERWAGRVTGWKVVDLPQALRDRLLTYARAEAPVARDPAEPAELGDKAELARFLLAAPQLPGADGLAAATTGVALFPHQCQVEERLAGEYPRSWLLADEVGLGKTISAGMALRRLVLRGDVRRALILAPASVCRQWQDELFEKFGLWVDRYDSHRWFGVHPDHDETLHPGDNPYERRDLLIASSHLARRRDHQELVLAAGPWDLVIVDEAHHARRQGTADLTRRVEGRLLELLRRINERDIARCVWLLTATPMQVHPIELLDLLEIVGLHGSLAQWRNFERWHLALQRADSGTPWRWFSDTLRRSPSPPLGRGELAVLEGIERRAGPVVRAAVERFGTDGTDPDALVETFDERGRSELRSWLRARGPVQRSVTRHSRSTLKRYRDLGLLNEPVADREVRPVLIDFNPAEQRLYKELDGLIDRLMEASGTSSGAGFMLTIYRRRLTSSWAAIRRTLEKRLAREDLGPLDDDGLVEEAERSGVGDPTKLPLSVPLSDTDVAEINGYLTEIDLVDDSKFEQLRTDLDEARSELRPAIVFTQFTDTLLSLRHRLLGIFRTQLATFTGEGGRMWKEGDGWIAVPKQDLVEAIRGGRVTVLLANDAASEGLNLQSCSFLVNYDMPWNPMRAEQRIGRIDRIGQPAPVVKVRNYFIPGTVEERVYTLLRGRIDDFSDLLGNLQPILGAAEDAVHRVFRAPRSERASAEQAVMADLDRQIGELRQSGIELGAEDPMPIPQHPPVPVTLEQLDEVLLHLGVRLGSRDRPVTTDASCVSRDAQRWTALATYGHPNLVPQLERLASDPTTGDGVLVVGSTEIEGVVATAAARADRTPPTPVGLVAELGTLGDAVSTGDAERAVEQWSKEAALARLEQIRQVRLVRAIRREGDIRQRFVRLVQRVIAAECARVRDDQGDPPRPMLIWLDLSRDTVTHWNYAETFRQHLGVGADELAPDRLADPETIAVREARRLTRSSTSAELLDLMREYREFRETLR